MNTLQLDGGKIDFKSPKTQAMIDHFLKCAGYEMECSEIVGRKFEGIGDHTRYLQDGGCAKILESLATL